VPAADLFHDAAEKASRSNQTEVPILVYDSYIGKGSQTDIPPGMPLIGRPTAQRIQRAVPRIDVGHLVNKTVEPQLAIDRQAQTDPLLSFCKRWKRSITNDNDAHQESEMIQATR
jgi:hypothetical protein